MNKKLLIALLALVFGCSNATLVAGTDAKPSLRKRITNALWQKRSKLSRAGIIGASVVATLNFVLGGALAQFLSIVDRNKGHKLYLAPFIVPDRKDGVDPRAWHQHLRGLPAAIMTANVTLPCLTSYSIATRACGLDSTIAQNIACAPVRALVWVQNKMAGSQEPQEQ